MSVVRELEKELEEKLRLGVKKLGGMAWKWVSPGNIGVPDRLITINGMVIFVELKTVTGRPTEMQKRQIRRLREQGEEVYILYGSDQVEVFLRNLEKRLLGDKGALICNGDRPGNV